MCSYNDDYRCVTTKHDAKGTIWNSPDIEQIRARRIHPTQYFEHISEYKLYVPSLTVATQSASEANIICSSIMSLFYIICSEANAPAIIMAAVSQNIHFQCCSMSK